MYFSAVRSFQCDNDWNLSFFLYCIREVQNIVREHLKALELPVPLKGKSGTGLTYFFFFFFFGGGGGVKYFRTEFSNFRTVMCIRDENQLKIRNFGHFEVSQTFKKHFYQWILHMQMSNGCHCLPIFHSFCTHQKCTTKYYISALRMLDLI